MDRSLRRGLSLGAFATLATLASAGVASAHAGSLGSGVRTATVPTWLTVLTGGIVVGGSFLFASLLTDHEAMRAINWWEQPLTLTHRARSAVVWTTRTFAAGVFLLVLVTAFTGPRTGTRNFALLFVWVGWWAGFTMTTYLVGNSWPLFNPWRALAAPVQWLAGLVSVGNRDYPERLGAWPSVAGLLGMVYLEVVTPVGDDPQVLATVILGYTVATLAGVVVLGDDWFAHVDPVSRVFRLYGKVAPVQRGPEGITFRLPSTALTDASLDETPGDVAFVVALLWATTYDGAVSRPAWGTVIEPLVSVGVPAHLVYLVALVAGFAVFLGVYRLASRKSRETADSYVDETTIYRWFAPSLLPIAAGYHVAHFLGYFLGLAPALAAVAASPLAPPVNTVTLVLPGWFGSVKLFFVLLGHVLAIWTAHSLAFELFPGVLKPVRSQYPYVFVMVFYTMTSMWIITQPFAAPPYV
jgi:hypothetical protein